VYAEERQHEILLLARADGRVDVVALAAHYGVTTETVRRDLTVLERAGQVRRVHGGAIPVERLGFEPTLPEEGAILLDAGSTTHRFAEAIPADRELIVVVNSPPLAMLLAARPNMTVIMIGGRVRGRTMAAVDDGGLKPLDRLHVDVAFMATNGLSTERGLTTPDPAEASMKRAMIACARRTVLLADHTKVGNDYLARFGALDDVDLFVTDSGLDPATTDDLKLRGLRVVRA
jgi:DeoR family fructose operon transcriptional repressor